MVEKEEDDDDDENTHTHKHARTDPCRKARARRKLARGEEKVAQETVLPARSAREATQDWKRKREPIYALLTVANNGDDTDDGLRGHGGNNVCVCKSDWEREKEMEHVRLSLNPPVNQERGVWFALCPFISLEK